MKRDEFEGLIQRLELLARGSPRQYSLRVGLLAALGYAYLIGVLLLLLACTVVLVCFVINFPNALTVKLAIAGGALTLGLGMVILRAFWVRLPPPQGLELRRREVPALFEMIDSLRFALQAP